MDSHIGQNAVGFLGEEGLSWHRGRQVLAGDQSLVSTICWRHGYTCQTRRGGTAAGALFAGRGWDHARGGPRRGGAVPVTANNEWLQTCCAGLFTVLMRSHGAVAMVTLPTRGTPVTGAHTVWRDGGRIVKSGQNYGISVT